MPEPNKCPQCGTALPSGALAGLCPACLLKMGAADTVTDAKQSAFQPPTVTELAPLFPQLEIFELVGKGGMGAVYKARQKQLDRVVALKILPPGIGNEPAFAERFTREAKALAKLNHPNIVTLYEFGDAGGQFYFLMEFVDGVNLRQILHSSRIAPREALAIVPQICDALQFAHDQGIVHRDIKPENILLDRRGRVKVADFGLAKIIEPESGRADLPVSQSGEAAQQHGPTGVMGTPNYMSPEQIAAPGEVDHRADIYALGVVFYQMLTGELPAKTIAPPSTKVQIDVRLDEIVLRALEKNPELRYQQVSEVKTCVETIAATPQSTGVPPADRGKKQESKLSWLGSMPKLNAPFVVKRGNRRIFNWPVIGINILWGLCLVAFLLPIMLKGMTFKERNVDVIQLLVLGLFAMVFVTQFMRGILSPVESLPVEPDSASGTKTHKFWPAIMGVIVFVLTLVTLDVYKPTYSKQIKSDYIGQTNFPLGDSIEITSVERNKNQMTVKGHYHLISHDSALLALYITTTNSAGTETDPKQKMQISKGSGEFELTHPHVVPGLPHVNMYPVAGGEPFAELYFGTKAEAAEEGKMHLQSDISVELGGGRAVANPPFVARFNQGEVELLVVGNQPWTNTVCWLPNGELSSKPFPVGEGSMSTWTIDMVEKKMAFRIHNENSDGPISLPVCRFNKESGIPGGSSSFQPPGPHSPDAIFYQTISCPTNAETMNVSLGVANGAWETAVTLKHQNNTSSSGSAGDWSATWNAVAGGGNVAVNCDYSKSEDWETRMVCVDDAGKLTVIPKNSSSVSTLSTGGILLVSSNEFARIKEFQLQKRKYQWVEFRNVSLQPGHMTTVTVKDSTTFTENPRGAKLRYELAQNGSGPQVTLPTKIIILTRATNQLVGTTIDTRTVNVWSDTAVLPGEKLRALVKQADGQITGANSQLFTMWSPGGAGTSASFSWFFKEEDGFGAAEAETATAQIRERQTKRPLELSAFKPLEVFCVTNHEGGTLTGYIEYDQAKPQPPDASGKMKATVQIRNVIVALPTPLIGYSAKVPPGYALRATASEGQADTTTPAGPYDFNSSWFRSFRPNQTFNPGAIHWNVQEQPTGQPQFPGQPMSQSVPFEVILGEPRLIFSATNGPGDVYQGFLELVGPDTPVNQ